MDYISINNPNLWSDAVPLLKEDGNKYDRGSVLVLGGIPEMAGACKMAAYSALRTGAGLVTIACAADQLLFYTNQLLSVMTKTYQDEIDLAELFYQRVYSTLLLGPGAGLNELTYNRVLTALKTNKPTVLDADALSIFKESPGILFQAIRGPVILTPHENEFKRLFALTDDRIASAKLAAKSSQAVVILKGHETIIASPNGDICINQGAPPTLATAGSGDVLAGIAAGLLANKVDAYKAACMAVWIHSHCALLFGQGLIAEDLIAAIPTVLKSL